MILVGELSLWIALLMCAWAVTLSFAGGSLRRGDLVASGERGAPLVWRAGPAGAAPGGDGVAEMEAIWRGVQARPWSPAHLSVTTVDGGRLVRWLPRTRLDGDRWDGETVAADAERWRVRVMDGDSPVRTWEVETTETLYADDLFGVDFPAGATPGAFRDAERKRLTP